MSLRDSSSDSDTSGSNDSDTSGSNDSYTKLYPGMPKYEFQYSLDISCTHDADSDEDELGYYQIDSTWHQYRILSRYHRFSKRLTMKMIKETIARDTKCILNRVESYGIECDRERIDCAEACEPIITIEFKGMKQIKEGVTFKITKRKYFRLVQPWNK